MSEKVQGLTGSELQRLSILLCLAKPCEAYLIDYLSQYLDVHFRIVLASVVKTWIAHTGTFCFLADPDYYLTMSVSSKIINFLPSGNSRSAVCSKPEGALEGS